MANGNILISEIPKAGKRKQRWSQGNYTKALIKDYFEVKPEPGTKQHKNFGWFGADGALHEETRPFGYRKSMNYGFELGGAVGIPYPAGKKRPIAVFRKASSENFRYQMLMPGHPSYDAINDYLQTSYSGSKHHRSRVTTTVDKLKAIWPNSPLL
jgi:hypothetical protein